MSWPLVKLPTLCRPKQWPTIPKTGMLPSGYPVFGANGLIGHYSEYNHEKPTILITCRGATCGSINVCEPKSYVTGNAMALDALDESKTDLRFLFHALKGTDFSAVITGVAQPQITRQSLARLEIPLPPLAEQKRIAAILDGADALRVKRREAIAQLDALLRSIFLDMFGDPVTNPMGWEVRALKETKSKVQIGPFGSLLHKEDYIVGGVPLVNPMHIVSGKIQVGDEQTVSEQKAATLSSYRLQTGDVVMGRRGEMGRCAIVSAAEAGMLCGTGSLYFRPHPDELSSLFLAKTLSSGPMKRHLEELSQGVTMPNLNRTMIEKLKIRLPPLDLQCRFATIVESVEGQKARQRAYLAELDNLFASLQSRAFRGDL